ncbi:MAG: protein adenylyltransferase SelO [Paracoccaceae bacterium]
MPLDTAYARLPDRLFVRQDPVPVAEPALIAWNEALAAELGIEGPPDVAVLAGNRVPDGAAPLAQLYAGHQFGHWNPQLGDGRAILLGEVLGRDVQLKGSGRTPFSRGGDGRAALGPVLREYVMSEAMHALGVPTTRALAAVTTGERVLREEGMLPGAILTRVADSHIRVGHFQVLAARGDADGMRALLDHAIARHDPGADGALGFVSGVTDRQARLVARWMSLGFIHGVMNTDNCAVSGQTIDYGPCAFMDGYAPGRVFSAIDRGGRYAYANQPGIALWNLAQLASALLLLEGDGATGAFETAINRFADIYQAEWTRLFCAKLGLGADGAHVPLVERFLAGLAEREADFTTAFAGLARDEVPEGMGPWAADWRAAGPELDLAARSNPVTIPRLHLIQAAIEAAQAGELAPFHALLDATGRPFEPAEGYTDPPRPDQRIERTFCGT